MKLAVKKSLVPIALALLVGAALVYIRRQPDAHPVAGANANVVPVAGATTPGSPSVGDLFALDPNSPSAREMDPAFNPYAGGLHGPGQSKRAWELDFLKNHQPAQQGDPISFELTAGEVARGTIRITKRRAGELVYFSGELTEPQTGKFFFLKPPAGGKAGSAVGVIEFAESQTAYRIEPTGANGAPELWQRHLDEVLCVNLLKPEAAATNEVQEVPPLRPDEAALYVPSYNTNLNGVAVVSLQSNPGSQAVVLLDFFGGRTDSWGGVNYSVPSAANNDGIKDIWKRVAEDYQPFNINVTTDIKVYEAAAEGSRQKCSFTDTPVTAAGVAYFGSWNWGGDVPCWSVYTTGKSAAEVAAHEIGHTVGLSHDTQTDPDGSHVEYYDGHGSGATGWGPTMGVGYYQPVTTWSKGEYQGATQLQNDLQIITTANNSVVYRADDTGSTLATSRHLEIYRDNSVFAEGVIERTADTDAFQFTTTGGPVALFARPVGDWAGLAVMATLANAGGAVIASNNPQTELSASISTTLAAGTYTFRVTGAGRNNPLTTGFSDYASLGYYSISGFVTGARQPTRLEVMEFAANGTVVGAVPASDPNANLAYTIVAGNSNNTFAVNSSGVVTVANNTLLDYDKLASNTVQAVQFTLFVNIINLDNAALTEVNRRVVIAVLDRAANQPIAFTGFNAGVIAPYNATTSLPNATGFDVPNNWCFYQAGLSGNVQVGGSGGAQGLPPSGIFPSRHDHTRFRFGPYGGSNALMLGAGYPSSGTLTFTTPKAYNSIAILATSANGGGLGAVVVHFTDGATRQFNFNAQDWYNTTANVALQGFGRMRLGQGTLFTENPGFTNPNFYQTTLNLAALGRNQPVTAITFNNAPGGGNQSCGIFAISGTEMPPQLQITTQPQSLTNNVPAQGATFTAAAMGPPPLGWQWYFSASGSPGTYAPLATRTNVALGLNAVLQPTQVGSYFVVVTNSSGAATSSVATLTLFRAPVITQQLAPTNLVLFSGRSHTLSVRANAAQPVTYQWRKNGATFASGTSSNYTFNNLQVANSGNYSVVLINGYGSVTSSVVTLTVVPAPNNIPYAVGVMAKNPMGYWRLNETSGPQARDYVGGRDGIYHSVALNQPGANPGDPDRAARFGPGINSYVGGIPVDFGTNVNRSFTIEAWVKGNAQTTDAGIVTKGTGAGGEQFNLDTGGPGRAFRFFIRDSFGAAHLATGNITPNGTWQHVVGVCDAASLRVILYVNGVSNANGTISPGNGILNSTSPMTIGSRQSGTGSFNNQFVGTIDEVAVYGFALTPAQIQANYAALGDALEIVTHPASQNAYVADVVEFSVSAIGLQPFSYQWRAGVGGGYTNLINGGRISGATGPTLKLNGITANDPTSFLVVVTNATGTVTSSPAFLTILTASTPPQVAMTRNGPALALSWPASHTGWRLQVQTNDLGIGLAGAWFDVAGATTTNWMELPINPESGSVFYRLIYP